MLRLHITRKWVSWPEANCRLLMAPLTVTLRSKLVRECTQPVEGKKAKAEFDAHLFNRRVAEECVHGWDGEIIDDATGQALPFSAAARDALMDDSQANDFIFDRATNLGHYADKEHDKAVQDAGKDSGG